MRRHNRVTLQDWIARWRDWLRRLNICIVDPFSRGHTWGQSVLTIELIILYKLDSACSSLYCSCPIREGLRYSSRKLILNRKNSSRLNGTYMLNRT